jgi:ELWxxDGT repeat protein
LARSFTQVNSLVFFSAQDPTHGDELWASDGTTAGTQLVLDINPGAGYSLTHYLTNVNGTLFFVANDGTHGAELWESNGSPGGTMLVKDIFPGPGSSSPNYLTNVNGTLFFSAFGTQGPELWTSNGSPAGTTPVKDIPSGLETNVNGTLFFVANDGTNGAELWASNGTAAGTVLVKDIRPGSASSYARYLTNVNGTLFFQANDGSHQSQLWASNGTAAGTFLVQDINPGGPGSSPSQLTNVNGTLFFQANDGTRGFELWESNGTPAGTFLVRDINPGVYDSYPQDLTNVSGTLFFRANDGTHGLELWESNGSPAGTFLVRDINPEALDSSPQALTNANGTLFFSANDGTHGAELWASNGTAAGTFLVQGIDSGPSGSMPKYLTNVNGTLFFKASDVTNGAEPWVLHVPAKTATTISSSPNPSVFGQAVAFTATVSAAPGAGSPTGMVDFRDGTTDLTPGRAALSGSQATFSTSALTAGSHTITAIYSGDSTFSGSQGNDSASPQLVNQANSATSLADVPGASVFGQPVAFVAFVLAVAPNGGTPTGTVTFKERATVLAGNVGLSNGHAGFITTSLSLGSHTITAFYSGDSNFLTSSAMTVEVVNQDSSVTLLSSSVNPAAFGQGVALTATVSSQAPGAGTPTGTVDFKEGATDLTPGGVTLSGGQAVFKTSSLAVGQHTITATYGGDANFTGSSGNNSAAPELVSQASSRTVLFGFPDPAVFGQAVSFTMSVSALAPGKGTPTGTVNFLDGAATIGTVSLNSSSGGHATFTTASLSRGNHVINVAYEGDSNFTPSSYNNFGEGIQHDSTTTTVTANANPAIVGTTITFTAAVQANAPGAGTATGTVTFKDITTVLGTRTLNGAGQATFTTSGLALGTHAITATYGADNNFTSSVSPIVAEVVKASIKTILVSSPSSSNRGPPAPAAMQRGPVPALSAQNVDDFFGSGGRPHAVSRPRPPHPRASARAKDWLETGF